MLPVSRGKLEGSGPAGEAVMPNISKASHQRILDTLAAARRPVELRRSSEPLPNGYQGFDLVEGQLVTCANALEGVADRDRIVGTLKTLAGAATLVGGGLVKPTVVRLRTELEGLWTGLESANSA
jgi:hypothetical protein